MHENKLNDMVPGNLSVLGYSQYNVSKKGEIVNIVTGKTLKPFVDRRGYENYSLWGDDGHRKTMRCHQLVAQVYIPNPNNYPQVDHLDCNKRNNSVSNLEWVDNGTNARRARENGLMRGQCYTREEAQLACEMLERGIPIKDICEIYGFTKDFVCSIKYHVKWKSVSWAYDF